MRSRLTHLGVSSVLVSLLLVLTWPATSSRAAVVQESPPPSCSQCGWGSAAPGAVESEVHGFTPGGGSTRPIGTRSSFLDACSFERADAGSTIVVGVSSASAGVTIDVDHWVVSCPLGLTGGNVVYTYYPAGDPPPAAVIADLIADAYARTPVVAFNPLTSPDGDEDIKMITQMITYLWVDDTAWVTPVSATASIPGFSVTTQATPRLALWSGGETPVACAGGDMHPYVFGVGGDDNQPSRCTMVYRQSSAVADHTVDLDVVWDVSYACSIPVCGGPLPDIVTSSTRPVIVGEIQAVNTYPGWERPRT